MEPRKLHVEFNAPYALMTTAPWRGGPKDKSQESRAFRNGHIQKLYATDKYTIQSLAEMFQLSTSLVHRIIQRTDEYVPRRPGPNRRFVSPEDIEAFEARKAKFAEARKQRGIEQAEKKRLIHLNRNRPILDLYLTGMTLRAIGTKVGVTGSRVQQILKPFPEYWAEQERRKVASHKRLFEAERVCKRCGSDFVGRYTTIYCSPQCQTLRAYLTYQGGYELWKREWNRINTERVKRYYHKHLKGTAKQKERSRYYNAKQAARMKSIGDLGSRLATEIAQELKTNATMTL